MSTGMVPFSVLRVYLDLARRFEFDPTENCRWVYVSLEDFKVRTPQGFPAELKKVFVKSAERYEAVEVGGRNDPRPLYVVGIVGATFSWWAVSFQHCLPVVVLTPASKVITSFDGDGPELTEDLDPEEVEELAIVGEDPYSPIGDD